MSLNTRVKNLEEKIKETRGRRKEIGELLADAILTLPEDKKNKIIEILKRDTEEGTENRGFSDKAIEEMDALLTEDERKMLLSVFEQYADEENLPDN